ncbi:MAG TPA: FAD:protein FMN transferase [Streptosporangiaceae bacterium]|nr:FAD:protein FMN transferase [Streptosporangiaceae bacterium]
MTISPVSRLETVMGTVITIDVYPGLAATPGQRAGLSGQIQRACDLLHRADEVFSTWREDSPVSRLRRGEISAADTPAEVADVIAACEAARELSRGWFDPWAMPGGFDPTGYVKGWAAQRALAALASADGISGAMVNAAGDIASSGRMPTGQPFRIGIADPAAPRRLAEIVELTGAVATSGSYERGPHLIDPRSGLAGARAASATVTGPDLGLADALATGLAVAGPDGLAFVEAVEGYAGLTIGLDGTRQSTPGFPFALR